MPDPIPSLRPTVFAVLIAAGALLGCERDNASQTAVRQAGQQFASAASGDPRVFTDTTATTYQDIIDAVSPHAGGEDGYAEAASVTLAQARLGQATQAAQEASRAETESLRRTRVIRGSLSEYLTMDAIAQAAAAFNPTADLSELESLIAMRREDASVYERQKADMDAQIERLEAQIAQLREQAAGERDTAGELGLRMASVNAQGAAELAVEAREHTLRADQADLEAMRIEGRVGQLRPSAAEIGLNVQKAEAQISLLQSSQEELNARTRAAQTDAAEARAAAASARDRLSALSDELASFRGSEVADLTDRVTGLLSQAQSDLRDVRGVNQSSAAVTRASVLEAAGSVWARRAAGHTYAASLFEELAAAGTPGPHAERARAEREAAAEAVAKSVESYRGAADALRSVRSRGEAGDRLNAAAQRLDRLAGIEPEPEEPGFDDDGLMEDGLMDDPADGQDASENAGDGVATLEDLLADLPEETRGMIMEQLEAQLAELDSIDDPEVLRETLNMLDEQTQMMPAEFAPAFNFVRQRIQRRIDEIENG